MAAQLLSVASFLGSSHVILIQIPCGPWITECQPLIYFDHKRLGRYVLPSCLQMEGWLLLNTEIVPYHAGVSWRTKTRDFCSTSALFHLRITCVNQSLFLSRIHTNQSELISSNSHSVCQFWFSTQCHAHGCWQQFIVLKNLLTDTKYCTWNAKPTD